MGTDIHIYVEGKTDEETWTAIPGPNPYYELYLKDPEYYDYLEHQPKERLENWIFDTRIYTFFTLLAGIRDTSNDGIIPISTYNEEDHVCDIIPHDVSDDIWLEYKHWRWDAHTGGCLTLKTILDYDWNATFEYINGTYTAKELADEFYTESIPKLKKLADEFNGPENIRIVYWFDN